jgi:hypothetical protein
MNQTFSLVILVEFPEEISFYVVPSDHPHLPALRKAAKNHAVVNTTVCSEEDTKTILDVFYPHQGDGSPSLLQPYRVESGHLEAPTVETIMVGFAL